MMRVLAVIGLMRSGACHPAYPDMRLPDIKRYLHIRQM
jgi:hypothetical protein